MTDASPTLPADWYLGPDQYEHERANIFASEWLWFASEAEVAAPCAYVAQEYAGWPLMVVRGDDGALRGFHNVCRHRAGPLVDDGAGRCANLVCQYHGWAYSFDGRLRSARDFGAMLDPDDFALHSIQVDRVARPGVREPEQDRGAARRRISELLRRDRRLPGRSA